MQGLQGHISSNPARPVWTPRSQCSLAQQAMSLSWQGGGPQMQSDTESLYACCPPGLAHPYALSNRKSRRISLPVLPSHSLSSSVLWGKCEFLDILPHDRAVPAIAYSAGQPEISAASHDDVAGFPMWNAQNNAIPPSCSQPLSSGCQYHSHKAITFWQAAHLMHSRH